MPWSIVAGILSRRHTPVHLTSMTAASPLDSVTAKPAQRGVHDNDTTSSRPPDACMHARPFGSRRLKKCRPRRNQLSSAIGRRRSRPRWTDRELRRRLTSGADVLHVVCSRSAAAAAAAPAAAAQLFSMCIDNERRRPVTSRRCECRRLANVERLMLRRRSGDKSLRRIRPCEKRTD